MFSLLNVVLTVNQHQSLSHLAQHRHRWRCVLPLQSPAFCVRKSRLSQILVVPWSRQLLYKCKFFFNLSKIVMLCVSLLLFFFFLTIFQTHLFHHDIFSIADNFQHQQPTQEHLVTECDDNCWKQDYLTFCCLEDHFRYMGNFCIKLFFTVS